MSSTGDWKSDLLKSPSITVLYHNYCADGLASAAVVYTWLLQNGCLDRAQFYPISYGAKGEERLRMEVLPQLNSLSFVLAVDLSLSAAAIKDVAEKCSMYVGIDHHRSTKDKAIDLLNMSEVVTDSRIPEYRADNILLLYTDAFCGAYLASWTFNPGDAVSDLVAFIDDQDRWVWKQPRSRAINMYIFVELNGLIVPRHGDGTPYATRQQAVLSSIQKAASLLSGFDLDAYATGGDLLFRYQQQLISPLLQRPHDLTIIAPDGESRVFTATCSSLFQSEAGNLLATEEKAAAVYYIAGDALKVSLRAHDADPNDLSVFASKFPHGGGHPKASGIELPLTCLDLPTFTIRVP